MSTDMVPVPLPPPLSDERRRAVLSAAVANAVRGGYRVESHTDLQAVLVSGKQPNHVLHLILTLVTCGLWGLIWFGMAVAVKERRNVMTVDPFGNVLWQ